MTSADDRIDRWRDVVLGSDKKMFKNGPSNIVTDGDAIYSYGYHFELARALRDARGKVRLFLINGDTYSATTGRHQAHLRYVLRNEESVIIPYSALESAGISKDSIKVLEATAERLEAHHHHSTEMPEGATWRTDKWRGGRDLYTAARGGSYITIHTNADDTVDYTWTTHRHWLGESLIRAKVIWRDSNYQRHERWATFLSGFDHAERRPLYFLAEMPYRCKATTVAEAYEALKPEPVVLALGLGREVHRQGDIFAVPVPTIDKKQLKAQGARFESRGYMLGTNHTATEVAYLPGGLTLIRGTMYHEPVGRDADHARHTVGKSWHVVAKNTVPTQRRTA